MLNYRKMSALMIYMPTFSIRNNMNKTSSINDKLHNAGLGAFFRPSQLETLGIGYHHLNRLMADGVVKRMARGLYRFSDTEPTERYTLAAACAKAPNSIVCLLSALQVYGIGTRLPKEVWLAIPHKARAPKIPDIKLRLLRFSGASWNDGIENIEFEGVKAHITSPARTVIDCFRFERLIGREAAMEALRDALRQKKVTVDALYRTLEAVPSRRLVAVLEVMEL
jgi:predicted transcriptional regulator of viral defense system